MIDVEATVGSNTSLFVGRVSDTMDGYVSFDAVMKWEEAS
jgi:hypothetical protein